MFLKKNKKTTQQCIHLPLPVELKLCYLKKSYIVTMSTFQMATLQAFEKADSLAFSDIRSSTGLPDRELIKQLQTLVDTKLLSTVDEVRLKPP